MGREGKGVARVRKDRGGKKEGEQRSREERELIVVVVAMVFFNFCCAFEITFIWSIFFRDFLNMLL